MLTKNSPTDTLYKQKESSGTEHYLDSLFKPRSVAVIGVSRKTERGGNGIFRSLRQDRFDGRSYAVGRSGGQLDGETIYPSIEDLPEVPELIFSAVGIKDTSNTLIEAAAAGVKIAIVFTAGFAEMNTEGKQMQREMVDRCNELGMRVVGPNCMGVFDHTHRLNLTGFELHRTGAVGLVSQSGNIALHMLEHGDKYGLGFHSLVTFGNQADIPVIDYLEYMGQDDAVEVILMYLESLQEMAGEDFIARARQVAAKKPIIAIKGGATNAGRRAAASHTARLSAAEDIYDAAFQQAGIIQVKDPDHLLAVTEALWRCPPMHGRRVAIVGSGGGHSTTGTDAIDRVGLEVPVFNEDLQAKYSAHLPPWAPMSNPLDMTGFYTDDLTLFQTLMRYPLNTSDFQGGLSYALYGENFKPNLVDSGGLTWETAASLFGKLQAELGKPIVFYTQYARDNEPAFDAMRASGVPCYGSLAEAAAGLAALQVRGEFLATIEGKPAPDRQVTPPSNSSTNGNITLTEYESLQRVANAGVPTVRHELVDSMGAAEEAANEIGYPVVLKAQWANVAHKSDLDGVRLGLTTPAEVTTAFEQMRKIGSQHLDSGFECTVSQQVSAERELILGIQADPTFGYTVVFGVGGTLTEVAARVEVMIPPIDYPQFVQVMNQSALHPYLGEWRGKPAVDLKEIHRYVTALHELCLADTSIDSVDINPLATTGSTLLALDAAVVVKNAPRSE